MVSLQTDNWFSFHAEMIRSLALIFHDDIDAEFCIVIAQLLSSAIKLRDGLYKCISNSTKVCYYNYCYKCITVNKYFMKIQFFLSILFNFITVILCCECFQVTFQLVFCGALLQATVAMLGLPSKALAETWIFYIFIFNMLLLFAIAILVPQLEVGHVDASNHPTLSQLASLLLWFKYHA